MCREHLRNVESVWRALTAPFINNSSCSPHKCPGQVYLLVWMNNKFALTSTVVPWQVLFAPAVSSERINKFSLTSFPCWPYRQARFANSASFQKLPYQFLNKCTWQGNWTWQVFRYRYLSVYVYGSWNVFHIGFSFHTKFRFLKIHIFAIC